MSLFKNEVHITSKNWLKWAWLDTVQALVTIKAPKVFFQQRMRYETKHCFLFLIMKQYPLIIVEVKQSIHTELMKKYKWKKNILLGSKKVTTTSDHK